jgi:hypothetical protein
MRATFAALIVVVLGSFSAQAEKRIFIIAYGVDRCLASGASCGVAVATAYCRSRQFAEATSFRKVDLDDDDITGGVPADASAACHGKCEDFVAIECAR